MTGTAQPAPRPPTLGQWLPPTGFLGLEQARTSRSALQPCAMALHLHFSTLELVYKVFTPGTSPGKVTHPSADSRFLKQTTLPRSRLQPEQCFLPRGSTCHTAPSRAHLPARRGKKETPGPLQHKATGETRPPRKDTGFKPSGQSRALSRGRLALAKAKPGRRFWK